MEAAKQPTPEQKKMAAQGSAINLINDVCRKYLCDADTRDSIESAMRVVIGGLNEGIESAREVVQLNKDITKLQEDLRVAQMIQPAPAVAGDAIDAAVQ